MNTGKIKRIPYGKGDFEKVNGQNEYYVDKTQFIPLIEKTPFVFLIRPRRFGKTLFLSMLHSYYDINRKDRFEELFHDTWILKNPTEERHTYLVLYLNFSAVNPDIDKVEESFNTYCSQRIHAFLNIYANYFPPGYADYINNFQVGYEQINALSS